MRVTPRDAGPGEGVSDGARVDAEAVSNLGELPAIVVKATGFVEMVANEVATARGAGSFNVLHDRGPTDAELGGQVVDLRTGAVALEKLVDFLRFQSVLDLLGAERSGSPSG